MLSLANGNYLHAKQIEDINLYDFLAYLSHSKAVIDFQTRINES